MDLTVALQLPLQAIKKLTDQNKKISTFTNSETAVPPVTQTSITLSSVLTFVLGVVIGLYAVYLSWQCNSKLNYNIFLKVIFAVFAYIFGLTYLILYLIMRWDVCRKI